MKHISVRSLHNQVIQALGQRIVSGQIAPGEALPREDVLAQDMGVSRTVLREAVRVLGDKGLVEARQKTGTRVREVRFWKQLDADVLAWRCVLMPTEDFVEKLVEMREIIEPAAAAAAAQRRTDEQLERIRAAWAAMAAAPDREVWAQADLEFHHSILDATNNELLSSLFSVVETALGAYFTLSANQAEEFKYSLPRHFAVYEAIRLQQPDTARAVMLGMIGDSSANMSRLWQRKQA